MTQHPVSSGARPRIRRLAALLFLAACGSDEAARGTPAFGDTAARREVELGEPARDAALDAERRWVANLGVALLVPPADRASGEPPTLVRTAAAAPSGDTTGLAAAWRNAHGGEPAGTEPFRVELFARDGQLGETTLDAWSPGAVAGDSAASGDDAGSATCASWPTATLGAASDRWQLALPAGRAIGIPLDSIERLPSRDSATFAATLTRLASAIPDDTSAFRGLPFVVRQAYRAPLGEGLVIGVLVRTVPMEDQPYEERTLLVVATPTDSAGSRDARRWRVAWHERVRGEEASVAAADPLALLRVATTGERVLALGRDDGQRFAVALLGESPALGAAAPAWRVRWERRVSGCP